MDYMNQMDTILKAVGVKTKECRVADKWDLATVALDSSKRHGVTGLRRSATAPELAELQEKPQQGVTKSQTEFLIVERAELAASETNNSSGLDKKNDVGQVEEGRTSEGEIESALEATELEVKDVDVDEEVLQEFLQEAFFLQEFLQEKLFPAGIPAEISCRTKEFLQEKRFLQEFLQKFLQEENFQNGYS
uniref:Uncharacterized protein n=1 Tax=Branchiostoma floridae TaxID=7739 RepID=C3XPX4_BRAFL|eukprot:XP_002613986.1 hypothetical protein BRAFLDRAFT_67433 [Branchiostoma floridae]